MTSGMSLFDIYKSYEGDSVMIGKHTSCKMVSIRTVKIKIFDSVVRILTNMRHISNFMLNFMFFRIFDFIDYSVNISGEVVKVKNYQRISLDII